MANRWQDLLETWEDRLRKAFLDSIYQVRSEARVSEIVRMLELGDIDGAIRAVGLDPVQFRPLDRALVEAYEAGGEWTAKRVPPSRDGRGLAVIARFNVRNLAAESWLRDHSATLIREITDDQRVMIRQRLLAGMEAGQNPRTTALDLVGRINRATGRREGGVIGLTASQEEWLRNYERELNAANPAEMARALDRKLRDARFDRAVRRAIEDGLAIPAATREKMVTAYKNRALRYRAEGIARTESMAALHQSQEESVNQAIASGAVQESAVSFIWRATQDGRVRDTHRAMDGQSKPRGQPFVAPTGERIRYPGDPKAPAHLVVKCRCWRELDIDFLAD